MPDQTTLRVFLPGEPIPPGTLALTIDGRVYDNDRADEPTTSPFPLVELPRPSRAELEAAVRAAEQQRSRT